MHLQLPSLTEIFAFITGAICVWASRQGKHLVMAHRHCQ
jgi:hypothetical protein